MRFPIRLAIALLAVFGLVAAACGDDDDTSVGTAPADAPTVVVTTNILGDVVTNLVGDQLNVETIMPVGADPHDFQPSAQQVAAIGEAAVLITNGAAFEEGLVDVIESAEGDGVPVFEAIGAVGTIEFAEGGHDDHSEEHEGEDHEGEEHKDEDDDHDEEHEGEDHADEGDEHKDEDDHEGEDDHDEEHEDEHGDDDHDEHEHDGDDPHFFTDPARMALAADGIADFLIATVDGIDADALRASADDYIAELEALDADVASILDALPDAQRVLITNHEVFGYFADRYDFEVVGTIIPSGSTLDGTSAQAIAELAEVIEDEGVSAIFSDTSSSDELVQTLAGEVGDVQVVELFTESLGDQDSEGATYLEMVRTNAERIAEALG